MKKREEVDWRMKIREDIPQDVKHKFAFHIAIFGFFVMQLITAILKRDSKGLRGVTAGMKLIYWERGW